MNLKFKALEPFQHLISEMIKFYTSEITNPTYNLEIREYCINHPILKKRLNNEAFLKGGFLTRESFKFYAIEHKIVESISSPLFEIILDKLADNFILIKLQVNTLNNNEPLYKPNSGKDFILFLERNKMFFNRIFGFDYIALKYETAVMKIEVCSDEKHSIGTGFVIKSKNDQLLVISNYHVIEDQKQIKLLNSNDESIPFEIIAQDKKIDLAVLSITHNNVVCSPFILNPNFEILNPVLTIGFPPIATSKLAYPLFHLGEINSSIETYFDDNLFLFSAKTNPGNSGGPVIDEDGMVIGVVARSLEEYEWYKTSKFPYCAAIPSKVVLDFLTRNNIA